jgi:hypothetical protein
MTYDRTPFKVENAVISSKIRLNIEITDRHSNFIYMSRSPEAVLVYLPEMYFETKRILRINK